MSLAYRISAILILLTSIGFSQYEDVQLNLDGSWHDLSANNGVSVSYKFEVCDQSNRQVGKYVLKIDNSTSVAKEVSFSVEKFVDGECINCNEIADSEHKRRFLIDPFETIEGVCGKNDKSLELFSHFIVLVPGMSGKHITNLNINSLDVNDK